MKKLLAFLIAAVIIIPLTVVSGLTLSDFSGKSPVREDETGEMEASGGKYVGGLNYEGRKLIFDNLSDRDVNDAELFLRLSAEIAKQVLYSTEKPIGYPNDVFVGKFTVKFNGAVIDYGEIEFLDITPSYNRPFKDYSMGKVNLKEGWNRVELIVDNNVPIGGDTTAVAPLVDCIKINTYAQLMFNPKYTGTEGLQFSLISDDTEYAVMGYSGTDTVVIIPPNYLGKPVTEIANFAFRQKDHVTKVILPCSIKTIGANVFDLCTALKSVILTEGLERIGFGAFYRCYALESVTIPDSVTRFGGDVFSQCTSLKSVNISPNSKLEEFGVYTFSNCHSLESVYIPKGIWVLRGGTFNECRSLKSVHIPDNVEAIGDWAFLNCSSLTSIKIPKSVIYVGQYIFELGNRLTIYAGAGSKPELWDDNWARVRGGSTYSTVYWGIDNTNFTEIDGAQYVLQNGTATLARYVGTASTVNIPQTALINGIDYTVTVIGGGGFYDCRSLTNIVIPSSVMNIGSFAFAISNSKLAKVFYGGTDITAWNMITRGQSNANLTNATRYYYSETKPMIEGNYWRFDIDGITPIIWT